MRQYLLVLFACFLLFASCENEEIVIPSNELILKEVRRELPSFDIMFSATFNTDGKIINAIQGKVTTSEFDEITREYIYNQYNVLECVRQSNGGQSECYPDLEYLNGRLIALNGNSLEYVGNTITEVFQTHNVQIKYEFEDDTYQKLTRIEHWQSSSLLSYENYTYEEDNLTCVEIRLWNDATAEYELWSLTEFTYDNERNPYQLGVEQLALVSYYQDMAYLQQNPRNLVYRSRNNVLSETISGTTSSTTYLYSYEYNSEGYPIKRTLEFNGNESTITFEYHD